MAKSARPEFDFDAADYVYRGDWRGVCRRCKGNINYREVDDNRRRVACPICFGTGYAPLAGFPEVATLFPVVADPPVSRIDVSINRHPLIIGVRPKQ